MSELTKFKCHKEVHARPMSRGDYNKYRGWTIPENENPLDDGYLVIYAKDSADHYESWSPKKQFDDGYKPVHEPKEYTGIMRFFAYKHLPEKLQQVSSPIGQLAIEMNLLPDGPEKSAGLRKLLEAKDCFVRAALG